MHCEKTVTTFDEAAGREIKTCQRLSGPRDGALGFNFTPPGLHWAWGAGLGAVASVAAGQVANAYSDPQGGEQNAALTNPRNTALAGIGVPAAAGAIMAIFKATRTAGWAMIGSGVVAGLAQYGFAYYGKAIPLMSTQTAGLRGIIAAQRAALRGAQPPVQVLGLPVARLGAGKPPVEVLGRGAPGVSVVQGAFGASFGTNFTK